jgi:hypothetical protein
MPSRPPSTPSDTTRESPSHRSPPHLLGSTSYRRHPTAPRPAPGDPHEPEGRHRQQDRRFTKSGGYGASAGGTPAGDSDWGRIAMAIGKCQDDLDIHPEQVRISFGEQQVYPGSVGAAELQRLTDYLAGPDVVIAVDLGIADGEFTVYGCDLTEGYVRLNSSYTT